MTSIHPLMLKKTAVRLPRRFYVVASMKRLRYLVAGAARMGTVLIVVDHNSFWTFSLE